MGLVNKSYKYAADLRKMEPCEIVGYSNAGNSGNVQLTAKGFISACLSLQNRPKLGIHADAIYLKCEHCECGKQIAKDGFKTDLKKVKLPAGAVIMSQRKFNQMKREAMQDRKLFVDRKKYHSHNSMPAGRGWHPLTGEV
jgi:hypothetical protein